MIRDTMAAAAPAKSGATVTIALVSSGPHDSAWFEHRLIAEETGMRLVDTPDLEVDGRVLYHHDRDGRHRVDVLYARMDEDMLLTSVGRDGDPLRHGLLTAVQAGNLTIANSLGNGVGDDKAVYAFVPAMIEYYLGEHPRLAQIPTLICAERDQRDQVLARLDQMVVKPIDGFGGAGITIGPEASDAALDERRRDLEATPERFIAQEIIPLSTHPTFDGTGFYPHHVDLRAFVHLRRSSSGISAHVLPACLSRVARRGTLVVNSSQGGGGKDTWILEPPGRGS
jgi:carboxylate-amine ligase